MQPYCRSCHLSFDHNDFSRAPTAVNASWVVGDFPGTGMVDYVLCDSETRMPQAQVTQGLLFHDLDAIAEVEAYVGHSCQP